MAVTMTESLEAEISINPLVVIGTGLTRLLSVGHAAAWNDAVKRRPSSLEASSEPAPQVYLLGSPCSTSPSGLATRSTQDRPSSYSSDRRFLRSVT